MLLHLDCSLFCCEERIVRRLKVLERQLRRSSDGMARLADYAAWLREAGLSVPSRQTLRTDLRRYTEYCDDLRYGEYRKTLAITVHAKRDAVRYFLGEPWLASPLKPALSSSVCRCLLLAMHLREEVEFQYAALPQPGLAPTFKVHRGVPLRTLPGGDSAYMAIWLADGAVMHINLTRVRGRVAFTGDAPRRYRPPRQEPEVTLVARCANRQALERCCAQFAGGSETGGEIRFAVPASLALMTADILDSWWHRTSAAQRKAERLLHLPKERVMLSIESKEH